MQHFQNSEWTWDPFLQQKNGEVEHELSETEHDEHERNNYEDNNGRDQRHNSRNLPSQMRTTHDGQDKGDRLSHLTLDNSRFVICVRLG